MGPPDSGGKGKSRYKIQRVTNIDCNKIKTLLQILTLVRKKKTPEKGLYNWLLNSSYPCTDGHTGLMQGKNIETQRTRGTSNERGRSVLEAHLFYWRVGRTPSCPGCCRHSSPRQCSCSSRSPEVGGSSASGSLSLPAWARERVRKRRRRRDKQGHGLRHDWLSGGKRKMQRWLIRSRH